MSDDDRVRRGLGDASSIIGQTDDDAVDRSFARTRSIVFDP